MDPISSPVLNTPEKLQRRARNCGPFLEYADFGAIDKKVGFEYAGYAKLYENAAVLVYLNEPVDGKEYKILWCRSQEKFDEIKKMVQENNTAKPAIVYVLDPISCIS